MSVPDNDRVTDCPVDAARRRRHAVDEDAHWRVRRAGDGELGAHGDLLARRLGDARVLALVVVLNVLDIETTSVDTTTLEHVTTGNGLTLARLYWHTHCDFDHTFSSMEMHSIELPHEQ